MANESMNNRLASRLATLRKRAGISARDMSLSLDQNPGYINNIEHGKALPSMEMFLKICERLEASHAEFFEGFEEDDSMYTTKKHRVLRTELLTRCAVIKQELANTADPSPDMRWVNYLAKNISLLRLCCF